MEDQYVIVKVQSKKYKIIRLISSLSVVIAIGSCAAGAPAPESKPLMFISGLFWLIAIACFIWYRVGECGGIDELNIWVSA